MKENVRTSWHRFLNPETLKSNLIIASIYSMCFEMLKTSIIEKIRDFFTNGFDENGMIISDEYYNEVLNLNSSPLYSSLLWLKSMRALDDKDIEDFEIIKECRNALTHEMLKFTSEGIEHDVNECFEKMVSLLKKIETWWFKYFEMEIDPDRYKEVNPEEIIPGSIWSLQMLIDIALGSEDEAKTYYEYFVKNEK